MESIEEIHKHIAELSFAIDVQLDVLKALEKRRSDARRALNSRLDPMARLPVEISSEIFIHCTPNSPSLVLTEEPLKFLHVCQLWREIAVACPSLWASIQIKQVRPTDPYFNKACWDWLGRARALPLSLSLPRSVGNSMGPWLKHFAGQIAHLTLHIVVESQLFFSLKICYVDDEDLDDPIPDLYFISSSLAILSAAPSLVECTFDSVRYLYANDHSQDSRMTHTSLRHLRLGMPSSGLHFSIPSSPPRVPRPRYSRYIWISHPSRTLEWSPLSTDLLDSCFRPLTALRTLELFHGLESDHITLLGVMQAKDFLPKLQHLLIHGPFGKSSNWKLVLDTIVARGVGTEGSLGSVKIISTIVWKKTDLPLEVLTRLRELGREEGMSIYAGSPSTNFV
ncbi:hypothetical protein R3P38DRAFT_2872793 [Favolaschia claudopus]|uniref:F-box domain-containing protein n=1 Tax=Favolaschia claudopus TaxID=2862362 RepID=A0AAW0DCL0_9AGAR